MVCSSLDMKSRDNQHGIWNGSLSLTGDLIYSVFIMLCSSSEDQIVIILHFFYFSCYNKIKLKLEINSTWTLINVGMEK